MVVLLLLGTFVFGMACLAIKYWVFTLLLIGAAAVDNAASKTPEQKAAEQAAKELQKQEQFASVEAGKELSTGASLLIMAIFVVGSAWVLINIAIK